MNEKKTRVPSNASKMAKLIRTYYAASEKLRRAGDAVEKANARLEDAQSAVDAAAKECDAAGFLLHERRPPDTE